MGVVVALIGTIGKVVGGRLTKVNWTVLGVDVNGSWATNVGAVVTADRDV